MSPGDGQRNTSLRFEEITIWRTKLPDVKHGILPPHDDRPNPLVADSMVYASVFAPGAVCALERSTGKLLWRKELPKLGSSSVHLAGEILFAKTAHTLYALNPVNGATIWSFCPYGDSGEWLYSSPTVYRKRVFIGDRCGYLHCLDLSTGQSRWKQLTNKAKNNDVNSTPIILKGLVIVGTNAKKAVAYYAETGKRAWTCPLDGPSVFGPLVFHGLTAVFTDSVYLLRPENGKIVQKFSWKNDGPMTVACTPRKIIAILRGKWPPEGGVELTGVSMKGTQFSKTIRASVPFLRYAAETKLLYISHLEGIDLYEPARGAIICRIEHGERPEDVGPVDVQDGMVYALTGEGEVFALRHPRI